MSSLPSRNYHCFFCIETFTSEVAVHIHTVSSHRIYWGYFRNGLAIMVPEPAGYMRCYCSSPDCLQEYWTQAVFEQHLKVACEHNWQGDVWLYCMILLFGLIKWFLQRGQWLLDFMTSGIWYSVSRMQFVGWPLLRLICTVRWMLNFWSDGFPQWVGCIWLVHFWFNWSAGHWRVEESFVTCRSRFLVLVPSLYFLSLPCIVLPLAR